MTNPFEARPDEARFIHLGAELMEAIASPTTNWLSIMAFRDERPQEVALAAALSFATLLSLIGNHVTHGNRAAKDVFAHSVCKSVLAHMLSLTEAEHVPSPAEEPNESLN